LPLVIFGPQDYGHRQGLLMVPARIAQALAPWLFGLALDRWGAGALAVSATVGALAFMALFMLPHASTEKPASQAHPVRP
jgi:predicted MFS family arabinose efflux permease